MNIIRFTSGILLIACLTLTGCSFAYEELSSHTNPIPGWRSCSLDSLDKNKAISDDYQAYMKTLKLTWRDFVNGHDYYEDGTGQHAVTISLGLDGTYWTYVLIYDKNDKRIKVKKWVSGHYAC